MAFKQTQWALSNIEVTATGEYIPPVEGLQFLKILSASYDEVNARYVVGLQSLANYAEFNQMYFFSSKDDDSIPPKLTNRKQMGCVASIGVALSGENIGIPNPDDIVGGVVLAEVELNEYNGKVRPRIWKYEAAPQEIIDGFADIEQIPAPSGEAPSEEAED